jgi:Domain of unknown function (DUF6391)
MMIKQAATFARPFLEIAVIRRTRRNHALEHATIHVLASRLRNLRMAGRSDASGFILLGNVPTEAVEQAVQDALRRLRGGEHGLALHPNCGTNLVTSAVMTTTAAMVGLKGIGRRNPLERVPLVLLLVIIASVLAQPLGMSLQKHFTTDGNPGDLEIASVERREVRVPFQNALVVLHRVNTQRG